MKKSLLLFIFLICLLTVLFSLFKREKVTQIDEIIIEPVVIIEEPTLSVYDLRCLLEKKDFSEYTYLLFENCIKYDIPIELLYGMILQESRFRIDAKNKRSNATGLMQITPIALKDYNKHNNTSYTMEDLYDPHLNIEIGCWTYNQNRIYLSYYGIELTTENLLRAYNSGCTKVKDGIYPNETQLYVAIISDTCRKCLATID